MNGKYEPDQVSVNVFDLIDSICADFRRQSKAGRRPKIEDFLPRVREDARANLFKNLLLVEVRFRQNAGERPSTKDYLSRFPHFRRMIGDAFLESTSISMEEMHSTPAEDSAAVTETFEIPAANRLGDYELLRELGRGGFGVVYEARHLKRGNRVALKTLPTGVDRQEINADRLHKFRREFRITERDQPSQLGRNANAGS